MLKICPAKKKKLVAVATFCVFVLPALIFSALTAIIPFFMNMYYSLLEWNGVSRTATFVGFSNFIELFAKNSRFLTSFSFSLRFAVFYVLIVNVLAFCFAVILSKKSAITTAARMMFFVPFVINLVAIGLLWQLVLTTGFESLYAQLGLEFLNYSWLGTPNLAFYTLVFASIWQNVGFYMVIYVAGLVGLPNSIIEAAKIDGASPLLMLIRIKIPLLMPSITVCMFTSTMFALKVFDIILVLTRGGPANSTMSIAYDIYYEAFTRFNYGMATAKSLIFFVVTMGITLLQFKFTKEKEINF